MLQEEKRTIVGTPLIPDMLDVLNCLNPVPAPPKDFKPEGDWDHTYRIWSCHGYRESGNENRGFLQIKRRQKTSEAVSIKVKQKILNNLGFLNILNAEIACLNQPLTTPVNWKLTSEFFGPDGKIITDLGTEDQVEASEGRIKLNRNGRIVQRKISKSWTGDWCLFDTIQRLSFNKMKPLQFDMLEEMTLLRSEQQLTYRGRYNNSNAIHQNLQWFQQTGHGILPYDYWVDKHHRLVLAVTLSIAYILDDRAEEKLDKMLSDID